MSSPYQQSKSKGYSDEQIVDFFSKKDSTFKDKYRKSLQKGYTPEQIFSHISKTQKPEPENPQTNSESISRGLGSAATGYASGTPYGIATNFTNLLALGDIYDPEEIEHIRKISEREGVPFNEEKYLEIGREALASFPTPSNIAHKLEEATGVPITPKEKWQKLLEMGTSAFRAVPGTVVQKSAAGVVSPATSAGLQEAGVPEQFADVIGFGAGGLAGSKTPPIEIGIESAKKESGLPKRQFEKLKEPREVSASKLEAINEKVESDFRSISDKIIKESPVGETFENLKNDPTYKQESRKLLDSTQEIADNMEGATDGASFKRELADLSKKSKQGFLDSEYDVNFSKFVKDIIEKSPKGPLKPKDLVKQYRKNNAELSEYFEPGASKSYNRAKRDAILESNRAIANLIEKAFPESKLGSVLKEGNNRWSKIMDAETIDNFISDMFEGKIHHKKGQAFFDDRNTQRIFKKSLGKNYESFEQLMKDMMTSEAPYKMLKVAKQKGYGDLFQTAGAFILHPTFGKLKLGKDFAQKTFKTMINSTLDKPQLALKWKKAIDALKKGKFDQAEVEFNDLKNSIHSE